MRSAVVLASAVAALLFAPEAPGCEPPTPEAKPAVVAKVESTVPTVPADQKASAPEKAQQAGSGAGLVVSIDPATGELRQPDAEEMRRLVGERKTPLAPVQPVVRTLPDGSIMAVLDPSFDVYSVVTKTPDGRLVTSCVDGKEKAEKAVAAGVRAPSREVLDEK